MDGNKQREGERKKKGVRRGEEDGKHEEEEECGKMKDMKGRKRR